MIIDITQKQTTHDWVVHMDALEVVFESLEGAQAFVDQLKARIAAPHIWPINVGPAAFTRPMTGSRSPCAMGAKVRADLVE